MKKHEGYKSTFCKMLDYNSVRLTRCIANCLGIRSFLFLRTGHPESIFANSAAFRSHHPVCQIGLRRGLQEMFEYVLPQLSVSTMYQPIHALCGATFMTYISFCVLQHFGAETCSSCITKWMCWMLYWFKNMHAVSNIKNQCIVSNYILYLMFIGPCIIVIVEE